MPDSLTHEQASSPHGDEPPDQEYEGLSFEEMDPSGRYGRFKDVLGRGACKVVYKAFDTQEGTEVAWNQVRLSDLMCTKDVAKEDRDRMFAEIRVLKALKHKNIMSFYDSWFEPKTLSVNFITELFTSGTLRQYRKRHKHVDSEVLKRWAWQILCGLVYLHGHNPPIIHRDLKCDNIFINGSDGVVKIGDLGLATMLRNRTAPQSVLGTPEFMAPELYEEDYDDRVDVYSFGMALLELATLEYPYAECTNAAQIYRKVSLGVRPQGLQKVTSPELAEFINTCIAPRQQRPRARQLLKHPYFDTVRQTLAPCKSELLLAAAAGGTVGMEAATALMAEGAGTTGSPPVAGGNLLADTTAAAAAAGVSSQQQGPPSVTSSTASGGPPSRSTSGLPPDAAAIAAATVGATASGAAVTMSPGADSIAAAGSGGGGAGSDAASVRSQRSNGSELAAAFAGMDVAGPTTYASTAANFNGGGAGQQAPSTTDAGSRMGSRGTSRNPSPPGSPLNVASPVGAASPPGSDQEEFSAGQCRCAATDRCFRVMGRVRLDEADRARTLLNLRLRIQEPDGTNRTVEFEFDLTHDTVGSVASEMVSDLELSPEDADAITVAMKREISRLSASMEGEASKNLKTAAAVLQAGLMENALLQANSTTLHDDDVGSAHVEEGVEIDSAAAAATSGEGANGGSGGGEQPQKQQDEKQIQIPTIATTTMPPSASTASFHEKWEEPSHQLRSNLSASSLHSEASVASVHSAHSTQSNHSIQSSPAQLAVPNDAPKNINSNGNGSNTATVASGPPQANMRLTRTVSMDRQFSSNTSINNNNGNTNGSGSGYSDNKFLTERNLSAGALSPGSGVLSPVSSSGHPDKRSLSKLFENLQEVAYEREQCVTPPPLPTQRPPLPPSGHAANGGGNGNSGGRLPQTKSSPPGMFAAMLASLNATAAANSWEKDGGVFSNGNGAIVGNLSESLLMSANGNGNGNGAGSTGTLSHPGSVDGDALLGSSGAAGGQQQQQQRLIPSAKGGAFKDKETLRKQAADAMKAVELRSLTLLEGSSGGSKNTRGTPMLATKQNGSCANLNSSMNGNSGPLSNAAEGGGGAGSGALSSEQGALAAAAAEQPADGSS